MPEQLGAYVLDRRIGAGGMADVFLARGPNGVCVIKRPHAHLCASGDFVRMFLDEASLLAQLNHPGIARIFDLGQHEGTYYLAMEYVPGFDLMTISLEHERQGEFMAPELAAKVVADAAGALHYAHHAVGTNGEPLHLIHRDVSPHNILVSTRGEVKLIDFGVARAAKTMHRTQAGLVKGKYPYMAPEQVTGQVIDCRVDVYALGLVLYELLTNARAIAGDLEVQQIDNARLGRIKPVEQLRPNIPPVLKKILSRALHPQPDGRYQTAAALQADLEAYIQGDRQVVGQDDLVRLFRVVAAEASHLPVELDALPGLATPARIEPGDTVVRVTSNPGDAHHPTDQVPLTGYDDSAPTTAPMGTDSVIRLTSPVPAGVQVGGAADLFPSSAVTDQAFPRAITVLPRATDAVAPLTLAPPQHSRTLLLALLVGMAILAGAAVFLFWPAPAAVVMVDPPKPPEVPPVVEPPVVVEPVLPVEPPIAEVIPEPVDAPAPSPVKAAVLRVTAVPAMEVVVDKKSWGVTPVDVEVAPGKHTVVLQNKDLGLSQTTQPRLAGGEVRELRFVAAKGQLVVHVEPFGNVAIGGRVIKKASSLVQAELWQGRHSVTVSNDELKKAITRTIEVKGGQSTELKVNLFTDLK
ncbi:MAG: Serine/threonine protein kinase PrkC, regulator of stationary phase [Myxococcaceae bacterium]|nr:Serine/threonine protein kinase PrkC, regulator of stationary phase [Myxococcaceae bacterium]